MAEMEAKLAAEQAANEEALKKMQAEMEGKVGDGGD